MHRLRSARLSILVFAGALTSALLLYGLTVPIEIHQRSSDGSTVVLEQGAEVGQQLTAHYPGLNRISVQTDLLTAASLEQLTFRLATDLAGTEDTILTVKDTHIEMEAGWIHFHFSPQPYPAPRTYIFYLSSDSTQPLTLYAHASNMYPEGERIGGEGDLVFEAGFRPSAEKTLALLLARLATGKPGLLGNPWTYVVLLLGMSAAFTKMAHSLFEALSASEFNRD